VEWALFGADFVISSYAPDITVFHFFIPVDFSKVVEIVVISGRLLRFRRCARRPVLGGNTTFLLPLHFDISHRVFSVGR